MKPDDPSARVSHETIYAAIYAQPRGGLKAAMVEVLRQAKPARGHRRTTLAGSAMVPESLRIIHRPEEIEARLVPGHCGMRQDRGRRCGRVSLPNDLIKGTFNRSSVGSITVRNLDDDVKRRLSMRAEEHGRSMEAEVREILRQAVGHLSAPRNLGQSIHARFAAIGGVDLSIATPCGSWVVGRGWCT